MQPPIERRRISFASFAVRSSLVLLLLILVYTWNSTDSGSNTSSRLKKLHCNDEDDCLHLIGEGDQLALELDDDLVQEWDEDEEEQEQDGNDEYEDDEEDAPEDFFNRAEPILEEDWPRLDNLTCNEGDFPEYPPEGSFEYRAPVAHLIGAMKAGTTALNDYLCQHPSVISFKRKEMHFYDFNFDRCATRRGIQRKCGRMRLNRVFTKIAKMYPVLQTSTNLVAIDDSPRYLFWSDIVPARALCVTPWAKIIAILRNPIDRAYSQFTMKEYGAREKNIVITFEEWIKKDIDDLLSTGVIQNKISREEFAGSAEEMEAWKRYTRLGTHAPIGRGLYAIQLRHWFQAYADHDKGRDHFMIIQSEHMKEKTSAVYGEVIQFLGLKDHALEDDEEKFTGHYHDQMKNETRAMLEEFYASYNLELYDLLGDDWQGVWDPHR